ncbi:MAG: lipoyl(octanoyl) transferase LipB [Armatimonadia bacterium]|nr:lipoyl(octanoyl) transferase LipB [Armatimonadia bacterium]
MSERLCQVCDIGRMPHAEAEALQERLVAARRAGEAPDTLLLVEHDPVVTIGSAVEDADAEVSVQLLESAGAEVRRVSRGGRATFHGPGQFVGYPILDLREHRQDLHWYLRALEQVLIDALGDCGFDAERVEGLTGVWVGDRKVASIGIAVRGWVTWHGFALNLCVDPKWWRMIDPCGLQPQQMASLSEIRHETASREAVEDTIVHHFGEFFGLSPRRVKETELFAGSAF